MQDTLKYRIHTAVNVLESAGSDIAKANPGTLTRITKPDGSIVTPLDKEIETISRRVITQRFKKDGYNGEESRFFDGSSGYVWVQDPINGTRTLLNGEIEVTTDLAIEKDGEVVFAGIYNPFTREFYTASETGELVLKSAQSSRSISTNKDATLEECVVNVQTDRRTVGLHIRALNRANRREIGKLKVTGGSMGYSLAKVAQGTYGAFIAQFASPLEAWDIKPGRYLVEKAGGVVTVGEEGKVLIAAANKHVYDQVESLLF